MSIYFFFNDTATTEIYTLSLHDALPIFAHLLRNSNEFGEGGWGWHTTDLESSCAKTSNNNENSPRATFHHPISRSEEHTSELQSRQYLVCRLLLEKKKMLEQGTLRDQAK